MCGTAQLLLAHLVVVQLVTTGNEEAISPALGDVYILGENSGHDLQMQRSLSQTIPLRCVETKFGWLSRLRKLRRHKHVQSRTLCHGGSQLHKLLFSQTSFESEYWDQEGQEARINRML
jgi:hypothetical protein